MGVTAKTQLQPRVAAEAFRLWAEQHPKEFKEFYARADAAKNHPSTRRRGRLFVDSRGRGIEREMRVRCPDGELGRVRQLYAKTNRAVIDRDDGVTKMVMCHRLTVTSKAKTRAA